MPSLLRDRRRGPRYGPSTVVRRSMLSFTAGSVVALLFVGVASVWVARDLAVKASMRDVASRGTSMTHSVVAPHLEDALEDGRFDDKDMLVRLFRDRLNEKSVSHIKLWDTTGQVVWTDEPIIGKQYRLEPEVQALFGTDRAIAGVSDGQEQENQAESKDPPLVEVYAGVPSSTPQQFVLETYWAIGKIDDAQWALLRDLIPLVVGMLLAFQLALFPLALSLARRVDRGLAEREVMMHHALSASELERRRIASQLHDGVIQDLAGIGFALPSIAAGLRPDAAPTHELLRETQTLLKKDVEQLRSMLTDLHPSNLGEGRLAEAVETLAFRAEREGVLTHVQIATSGRLSPAAARMAYRIVREGVHNVLKHARAETMTVTAGPDDGDYVVEVLDDGQGLGPSREEAGHMGLQLLGDTLADLGGSLSVTNGPLGGTLLVARFPESLTELSMVAGEDEGPGPQRRWSRLLRRRKKSLRSGGDDGRIHTTPPAPAPDLEAARDPRPARR